MFELAFSPQRGQRLLGGAFKAWMVEMVIRFEHVADNTKVAGFGPHTGLVHIPACRGVGLDDPGSFPALMLDSFGTSVRIVMVYYIRLRAWWACGLHICIHVCVHVYACAMYVYAVCTFIAV